MRTRAAPHTVSVTRYYDADGRPCRKDTRGAVGRTTTTQALYGVVGGRRVALGTSDMGTAWITLRRLQREHADREAGIRTVAQEQAAKTLADHMEDWLTAVGHGGAGAGTIAECRRHVMEIARLAGWERIGQIERGALVTALATLRKHVQREGVKREKPSPTTRNHYLRHVRQFCRWLADHDRLPNDPTRGVKRLSTMTGRAYVHRCPTDAEMARLFAHLADDGAERTGGAGVLTLQGGAHRALAYRVAMATGLRKSEVRSLTRRSFDLTAATVRVEAAYSKHRRVDVLPLPGWLVAELREWFAADGPTWGAWPTAGAKVLQADLAAAGLEYRTDAGYWSWHSFRTWYVTTLANQPNISPKTLMELARHSTAQLTMSVYAKARTEAMRDAVNQIPPPNLGCR